jgi:hypothetical protein
LKKIIPFSVSQQNLISDKVTSDICHDQLKNPHFAICHSPLYCFKQRYHNQFLLLLVLGNRHINPPLHQYRFNYKDGKVAREMFDVGDFIFSYTIFRFRYRLKVM